MRYYLCSCVHSYGKREGYVFAKSEKSGDYESTVIMLYDRMDNSMPFRISKIKSYRDLPHGEVYSNAEMCEGFCNYCSYLSPRTSLNEVVLCTDDADEMREKFEQLNLLIPNEYKAERFLDTEYKNETAYSDEIIKSKFGECRFSQITRVLVNLFDTCSKNTIEYITQDGETIVDAASTDKVLFSDSSFEKWWNENFIMSDHSLKHINNKYKSESYIAEIIDDMTIDVKKVERQVSFGKHPTCKHKELYYMRYSLKRDGWCRQLVKKEWKDVSPTDMFKVNSQNKTGYNFDISYLSEDVLFDFSDSFMKNSGFYEKIGYSRFLRNCNIRINAEMLFIWFLIIMYEYPALEILLKAGHDTLVNDIIKDILDSGKRQEILYKVRELEELVNPYSTKESDALRLPSYILSYLKSNNSNIRDYLFWRDVYELENLSLEQFQQVINSCDFIYYKSTILMGMHDEKSTLYDARLQEIIKYDGYTLMKTIKYLHKQAKMAQEKNKSYRMTFCYLLKNITDNLVDTLKMAEELDIEVEKYPGDILQIHNELFPIYQKEGNERDNYKMAEFAELCEDAVKNVKSDKFICVFPKSNQDFIQEGINQHNCVASYFRRVINGECIVFFIRKKEEPSISFITAEVTKSGLRQVMLSNNRIVVCDTDEHKFAKKIEAAINAAYCCGNKKLFEGK